MKLRAKESMLLVQPELILNATIPLQTVCTYWLKGLCALGDACGFLHQYDKERMPVCRTLIKFGECKEPDCPYKHSIEDVKVTFCSSYNF